jgi:hypothetical protein
MPDTLEAIGNGENRAPHPGVEFLPGFESPGANRAQDIGVRIPFRINNDQDVDAFDPRRVLWIE